MKIFRALLVVMSLALALFASACEQNADIKLAFVTNNASDYWTIARKGVEKADGELDQVSVEFKLPGEGTAA